MAKDIFEYIKEEEIRYAQDIEVLENWNWNMKGHVRTSMLFKHGKFKTANNDLETKSPYKNIIYPILNLRYRAEDIDMKDVVIYVDDAEKYHLSFLVKKYHDEVYVRDHDLDTFFDETKEEKIDFGGVLVRKGKDGPIYEPLESIAFCDQTSILSGPLAFKMFFSPDELYETEKQGWGNEANGATVPLDELVTLAEEAKKQDPLKGAKTKTPGKYIEIYRVHGSFPKHWLTGDKPAPEDKERYVRQMHIVGFYKSKDGLDTGVTLYRKQEYNNPFKLHLSGKKIRNRALAYGGVEELFDPQIWTNYSEIRKRDVIDAVSKIIRWTDDELLASRNKIKDMDNNEMLTVQRGAQIGTLDTNAPNIQFFNEWIKEWDVLGQTTSGATEALLGKNPSSGTPFALENLVASQGMALHDYRRGRFATFIAELYMDWIIPSIAQEISKGTKFLSSLSPDEMEYVTDCLVRARVNELAKKKILAGEVPDEMEMELYKQVVRDEFAKGGNKKFIEILKGEFDDVTLSVKVNVAGKQKDLASVVDKMVNIFRQVFANPAILDNPKAAKVFNKLIEYSGLDPIDFGYASNQPQPQPQQDQPVPSPIQQPKQPQTV